MKTLFLFNMFWFIFSFLDGMWETAFHCPMQINEGAISSLLQVVMCKKVESIS